MFFVKHQWQRWMPMKVSHGVVHWCAQCWVQHSEWRSSRSKIVSPIRSQCHGEVASTKIMKWKCSAGGIRFHQQKCYASTNENHWPFTHVIPIRMTSRFLNLESVKKWNNERERREDHRSFLPRTIYHRKNSASTRWFAITSQTKSAFKS